jgi:hypothetical protein
MDEGQNPSLEVARSTRVGGTLEDAGSIPVRFLKRDGSLTVRISGPVVLVKWISQEITNLLFRVRPSGTARGHRHVVYSRKTCIHIIEMGIRKSLPTLGLAVVQTARRDDESPACGMREQWALVAPACLVVKRWRKRYPLVSTGVHLYGSFGVLAQLEERRTGCAKVTGSRPVCSTREKCGFESLSLRGHVVLV